ncbi:hypothetical protein HPB47_000571 [Ixodes persulcatus]|uniref:Uncharacterized protein n=1 Tax=Ixodes persulcatus TaxID=34615 RepID=A0AC60QZF2_IXOPE|nr:hypothetical protein HPB47_000571 [Ixodes persulcatus]
MATPNKRRKKYLESGEPSQLPRTTYNRNSARIAECADTSHSRHGTSVNEPSPSTSRYDQPTNDGVQSDQAETDGFLEETFDGEGGMVVEDEYGNPVGQGDSIDTRLDHDSHASDSVLDAPVYDEPRCLADSFAEYGKSTLPHSTTTKAEAVALIMAFLTSETMPWTALDKLLHLVNRLFGAGTGYRHLQQSGLHEWTDLTITFNTDGSPLYKSSRASVWPVQFIVNELPPSERFNHCVLGGLWFGSSHPDMSLFMTKFVEEVTSLGSLTWEHDSTVLSSKVHALCCCVDAPARAEVRHHVQYNGYFGCSWCLASGEHLEGSLRYRGKTPDEERTPEGVRRDMQLALLSGASVNGFKGPSPLTDLPHFNLVWGFSVDYMH